MKRIGKLLLLWLLLCLLLPLLALAHMPAAGQHESVLTREAPLAARVDPPVTLVEEGVANLTMQGNKLWWWYTLPCAPTRAAGGTSGTNAAPNEFRVEEIARIAATGGITRTLFLQEVPSPGCGDWSAELLSNVAADGQHLYWMSNAEDGLVKLSINANVGDPVEPLYTGQSQADEIEERGSYVYLMNDTYGIIRVQKNNGLATPLVTALQLGGNSRDLQLTNDYVYWNNNGALKVALNNGGGGDGIAPGVTAYVAENSLCTPAGPCPNSEYVFIALGDRIRRYDLDSDTLGGVLYDSPAPAGSEPAVVELTVDEEYIYFFERRKFSCEPFCTYDFGLFRMPRTGGAAETLYFVTEQVFSTETFDLTLGGPEDEYLFWHDEGQLRRLPRDAEALPLVDVSITGIEVTQAIQDLDNTVQLVREKRTGVRVHVDANGQNVAGIVATLYRINGVGVQIAGPIYPSGGSNYLTVPDNPSRENFNHAFYFALPPDWVNDATLRLRAEVNPTQLPPEPDYGNNTSNTPTFTMRASPTLRTHLLAWEYEANGTNYAPDLYQDIYQARSWIRRTYPLASTTGGYDSPDPGFRLDIRTIVDDRLGGYVLRTSAECLEVPEESREFCAAGYANNYAQLLRATEAIPEGEMIYSMIWEEPSLPFPRGFATNGVSAGPTGTSTWFWDYDGSYGDWYMGHEVGHNAGRNHPSQGNTCGHSASDANFPYPNAAIGEGDLWGFDVGDMGLNGALNPRVYSNAQWRDMMSYCNNQWISDYTYEGIYDFLTNLTAANRAAGESRIQPVRAGSGFIALFGMIYEGADTGAIQLVSLWDSPGPYTPPSSGPYRMRFLDGNGAELAGYDFNGEANDTNPSDLSFGVVVAFPANTAEIELVRKRDGLVLDRHFLSANPPVVSDVALLNPSNPVTGTVTLQWQASDADGDTLHFDVYYTDDNGASYTAYALGLGEKSVALDTSQMAGSAQARFRVVASDGTRTAEAESATFTLATRPPTVVILTPQDGLSVVYGTAVNFTAEVEDLQGHVPDGNMQWYVNGAATGIFGPEYTAYLLPVGRNRVSLRAMNGSGQMAEEGVLVVVHDNLEYPGPTLSVGPDQISWQVAEGTAAPQQATLTISNIGTGELNWTAGESASWLTLSPVAGGTPGIFVLVADPTAVTPGVPVGTMVTISGDNGQTLQLPVSLLVGQSPAWFPPAGNVIYDLFLPIGLR